MNQTEVVLISKEDYARRTPVQPPVIRQEVRPPRGHESVALSTLQDEVRDLKVKMTKLFEDNVENHRLRGKQTDDNFKIYTALSTLSHRMAALEQHAPAIARFEAHEASYNTLPASQATIAQLLSRVAALERPWHRRFTRASDPPDRTPPATNMTVTALLRRMDEFNS